MDEKRRPPGAPRTGRLAPTTDDGAWPLEQVAEAVRGLRYGTVTIVVQDGRTVQLERTEKVRLA